MQFVVGDVLEGKVTGLTSFGAFVEISGGKTGMVHISEVSNSYVKDIKDCLKEGQEVKVKVLSIGNDGKISLSIKRTLEPAPQQERKPRVNRERRPAPAPQQNSGPSSYEWQPKRNENLSFEDMMSRFKQVSDEKMTSLKRGPENSRRTGFSKKNGK
ncbi:MAG: S1 RNA-binding domain-containing protein [Clostridia bacterium]|nr:S1 RNA-binding domain-containing protein [Clostridia bacterium]